MPDPRADVLWMPACPRCGHGHRTLVFVPGDERGPPDTSRIHARWTCAACGQLNYLPRSRWVRAGAAPAREAAPVT